MYPLTNPDSPMEDKYKEICLKLHLFKKGIVSPVWTIMEIQRVRVLISALSDPIPYLEFKCSVHSTNETCVMCRF